MDSADTSSSTTAEDGGGNLGSIDIIFGAQWTMKNPIWHPFALDNPGFLRWQCSKPELEKGELGAPSS